MKVEYHTDKIKELALREILGTSYYKADPNDYEAYFYIDTDGEPTFVIEQAT